MIISGFWSYVSGVGIFAVLCGIAWLGDYMDRKQHERNRKYARRARDRGWDL